MRQAILVFADPFRFKGFDVGGGGRWGGRLRGDKVER